MLVYNPFKRTRYTFRTILSPEQCSRRLLETMNEVNRPGAGRYVIATAIGERLTAKIEPGSLGSRGSGGFMKHFVVEAVGAFSPQRDGTVHVTIAFHWPTSLGQVIWRLLMAASIPLSVWTLFTSPIVPIFAVCFGIGLAPLFLLWSLVALVQGMRQAGKDWSILLQVMQAGLGATTVERA